MKANVGYSVDTDSFRSGEETAKKAIAGMNNSKIAMLYTSVDYVQEEVINGAKSVLKDTPIIGCTSSGAVMVPDGIITSDNGFSAMMIMDSDNLNVGVAASEKDGDARETGRKIALEAIKNSGSVVRPSYFYMVASPAEEESYLKGIQDVIGRVPFFGGSAADNAVVGDWKIFLNDKVFSDGCAVVFFYTSDKIATEYTGFYNETSDMGIITKIEGKRKLVEIDGVPALEKYASWIDKDPSELMGQNLLFGSILNPLGVKDPIGNLTVIRHPMVGNEDYSMNIGNDLSVGTCVMKMNTTVDELIKSTSKSIDKLNEKLNAEVGAYFLVHCGGRKVGIGNRLDETYNEIKDACKDTPFITIFTFGEYGYNEHSANTCGGLMLSFTGFSK